MPSSSEAPTNQCVNFSSESHVIGHENRFKEESNQSDNSSGRPKRVKVYPERVNRVRAKTPKTRSGCKTCKQRHVKCGEEKPFCLKCLKFGIACDGYASHQPRQTPRKPTTKPLLPRTATATIRQSQTQSQIQDPLLIIQTSTPFSSELEYQYFLHFRDSVSHDLSGPIPTKIWTYVVLQATHETSALRDLTISISALSKSKSNSPSSNQTSHRAFAIHQYAKALHDLRQIINQSDENAVRISLIASLLIFCFENIHGDYELAVSQLRSALMMMRRLCTVKKPYSRLQNVSSVPGMEEDVLDLFVRLDNTIMSRLGSPESERTSLLQVTYDTNIPFSIPPLFNSIHQAKIHIEHLQYKGMPYLTKISDVLIYGDAFASIPPREAFDEAMDYLRQWSRAFNPLFEDARRKGGMEFIAAATLRALLLATEIATKRIFLGAGEADTNPNLFVAEAREIVDLSRAVAKDQEYRKVFVVDCGVIPSLFMVVMICREREVREAAVEVLEDCGDRMEVTWNASEISKIGRQVLMAEDGVC